MNSGSGAKGTLGAAVFGAIFFSIVCAAGWLFYRLSQRDWISQTAAHLSSIVGFKPEELAAMFICSLAAINAPATSNVWPSDLGLVALLPLRVGVPLPRRGCT